MLNFIFILFVNLFSVNQAQADDKQLLAEIREKLPAAFKEEKDCNSLFKKYQSVSSQNPILNGYIGGLYIARSKHAPLFDKVSILKTGTTLLENSIKEKPDDIELRFLRMTIQLNLPGFLGYHDHIESDKKFVLKHYRTAMPTLQTRIINFVKTSGFFNEEEIKQVSE